MEDLENLFRFLRDAEDWLFDEVQTGDVEAAEYLYRLRPTQWTELGQAWTDLDEHSQHFLVRSLPFGPREHAVELLEDLILRSDHRAVVVLADDELKDILAHPPVPYAAVRPPYEGPLAPEVLDLWLGDYPFGELRRFESTRPGYEFVVGFEPPDPTDGSGLFVDLTTNSGMHSDGLAWQMAGWMGSTVGHAWDDNTRDPEPDPVHFPDWLDHAISSVVGHRARSWAVARWPGRKGGADWDAAGPLDRLEVNALRFADHDWAREVLLVAAVDRARTGDTDTAHRYLKSIADGFEAADFTRHSRLEHCVLLTRDHLHAGVWSDILDRPLGRAAEPLTGDETAWAGLCRTIARWGDGALSAFEDAAWTACDDTASAEIAAAMFRRVGRDAIAERLELFAAEKRATDDR